MFGRKKTTVKAKNAKQPRYLRHHPFVVPVITFLVLFFLTLVGLIAFGGQTIGANDTKVVVLYVDGQQQVVPTRATTVEDLLNRLKIQLDEKDIVEPGLQAPITEDNFTVNIYNARPVLVEDGNRKIVIVTAVPTPREVAKAAGLKIFPEDFVEEVPVAAEPLEALNEGVVAERVIVERAIPVHLNLYGKQLDIRTHAATVGDLLAEKSVNTLEGDIIQPKREKLITKNLQIFVYRKGKKIISREEVIPPPIERREDPAADLGTLVVLEPGVPGKRVVTYEIELRNGKEFKRREIQSIIVEQPEKRVIRVGTKRKIFSGGFEAALAALRGCESGGNYSINTGNGYYGAYQYNLTTWNNYGGYYYPNEAPPFIQDQRAWETYQARGWQPWPHCSQSLGLQDVYR